MTDPYTRNEYPPPGHCASASFKDGKMVVEFVSYLGASLPPREARIEYDADEAPADENFNQESFEA